MGLSGVGEKVVGSGGWEEVVIRGGGGGWT